MTIKKLQTILFSILFIGILTISGCATSKNNINAQQTDGTEVISSDIDDDFDLFEDEFAEQDVNVPDPLESFNRFMFSVNDTLYFAVVKPVTGFYSDVMPEPARISARNFFQNLTTPIRLGNCMLQGKWDSTSVELDRFLINSTFGILGIADPALEEHGLKPAYEDLGQTLAVHEVENGFYIVLPLLGPSTLRDAAGKFGDIFLNPTFYIIDHSETALSVSAFKFTNEGSFHKGQYEQFKTDAVDPYIAMREAYLQYRKEQIEK
jgi:phospholipid-binding lipoprotein MlaA